MGTLVDDGKDRVVNPLVPGEWEYPSPLIGEFPVTRPTPLQMEIDQYAGGGGNVMQKVWDLSPIQADNSWDATEPPGRPTAPPINTLLPQIQLLTDLAVGSQLVSTTGSWNPVGTSYTRQWFRGATPIGGQTAATYNIVAADVGNLIGCTVTAINGGGSVPAQALPVGPAVPANTVLPVVTGTGAVGSPLTCSNGTWTPNVGLTYAKQWLNGGTAIPGATGNNYTPVGGDVGFSISCAVMVTQTASGAASGFVTSNAITITTLAEEPEVETRAARPPTHKDGRAHR
jgi:hypothetical protein